MPRKPIERPDWNFLKFKHFRFSDDGTLLDMPTPAEHPWETDKIRSLLDQITRPEKIITADKKYKVMVSEEKATLEEVKELGHKIQKLIETHRFPSRGIHYPRHAMCTALFDELIRQVIIEHPDIGEILLRIRDHYRQEIYNYQQVFNASQAYGCRKQFMEKNDERLNELEAEAKDLQKKQEKAIKDVENAYDESVKLISEFEDIDVDDVEYWRAVQFYRNYIKYLLYYFDLRAEEEKIKEDLEEKEEDTEEEEEEEESEGFESFTLGDDKLEEEEEEPPGPPEEEVKVDTTKQQKEEPIDKDLIYRENEEEIFDSDIDTEQTVLSDLPKSQDDVIPPTETDPVEHFQMLLDEELKHDVSFTDVAKGFMKKAYEEELRKIEEKKRLEEERKRQEAMKLEMEKRKLKEATSKRKAKEKKVEIEEEFSEECSEEVEEEEAEETVIKETIQPSDERIPKLSKGREGSIDQLSDESETENEIPFLTKPKYALLRRLTNTLKCKDLVQRIPDEPTKKRKVKKILVKQKKSIQPKPKLSAKPIEDIPEMKEIPQVHEAGEETMEESLTAVRASEFKWGVPLLEYFAQTGQKMSVYTQGLMRDSDEDTQEKKEEVVEDVTPAPEEAVQEEESELFSSGLTIGRTESFHSSQDSKVKSLSIDEEGDEKEDKSKTDLVEEEEDDDESVLLF